MIVVVVVVVIIIIIIVVVVIEDHPIQVVIVIERDVVVVVDIVKRLEYFFQKLWNEPQQRSIVSICKTEKSKHIIILSFYLLRTNLSKF